MGKDLRTEVALMPKTAVLLQKLDGKLKYWFSTGQSGRGGGGGG